jgi:hypothetical protein
MMARLGLILQSVFFVVILLVALACASGTDKGSAGAGAFTGTGGTTTVGGQSGTTGTNQIDPLAGAGGTTFQGSGGTGGQAPICGNNIKESGEICDGTDLGDATCDSLATGNIGTLSCAADCLNYDTTMCYPPPDETPEGGVGGDGGPGY